MPTNLTVLSGNLRKNISIYLNRKCEIDEIKKQILKKMKMFELQNVIEKYAGSLVEFNYEGFNVARS